LSSHILSLFVFVLLLPAGPFVAFLLTCNICQSDRNLDSLLSMLLLMADCAAARMAMGILWDEALT